MFCSTIIPTIARPSLSRAVNSVLNQSFSDDDYEIIVVNDSGSPLPYAEWQNFNNVHVINTNKRERSIARNTGASIAKGKYLHFLDDDDWLLPGALQSVWELAASANGAIWLYGGSQLVDRKGIDLIQIHHGLIGNCFIQVMAGEWIPLQSSLIEANAFFSVGGFNPNLYTSEDVDLCRKIALLGDFITTSMVVASIGMGQEGSTTDLARNAELRRQAREGILESPNVFSRMLSSARGNQWKGRLTRIYLTSVIWNLQNRRLFSALNRATYGLISVFLSGFSLFSVDYWQSVFTQYESDTFLKAIKESNNLAETKKDISTPLAK